MVVVAGSTHSSVDDVWQWGDDETNNEWCRQQDDVQTRLASAENSAPTTSGEFLVFDFETGPQDDEALKVMLPEFVPPEPPGPFDESLVKLGNLKDPAKIKAKIEEAQCQHAASVASYSIDVARARANHWNDFRDKAALNATTGRLVAIGLMLPDGKASIIDCDSDREESGLRDFWKEVEACLQLQVPMIGFNSNYFDLPFAIRRSWILGVPVPTGVRVGRFFNPLFIDLMRVWALDGRDMVGLDTLAKAFGLPAKVKEVDGVAVSGATFYQLWRENRVVAEKYLARDLEIPAKLARLMGVV